MTTLNLLSYDLPINKALAMAEYLQEINADYVIFSSSKGRLFIIIPILEGSQQKTSKKPLKNH